MSPPTTAVPPRRRRGPRVNWDLFGCAFGGHELVGTDAAEVRPEDHALVRADDGGARWYRCLRCDSWQAGTAPETPARQTVPARHEIAVPLRGRPLRDRYVLRVIAVERALHIVVLALLALVVFEFARHQRSLRDTYTRVLNDLQGSFGGPVGRKGLLADLDKLFKLSTTDLYLIGAGLLVYCVLLGLETVGLWYDRRWAEYLTFVETGVLVPYEIYELVGGVSAFKVISLVLNLAILVYLALAHRLFGLRGGLAAIEARRADDSGWPAVDRATPPPPAPAPSSAPAGSRP